MVYEDYYGLSDNPFQLTPDARYFFTSKPHAKGLDYLRYGLSKAEGFIVVTGEIGAGKTTLINFIREQLATERVVTGCLAITCVDTDNLLRLVAGVFDIPIVDSALPKAVMIQRLETFLLRCGQGGQKACLIIDEAQGLSDAALEELRMLSNIQAGSEPVLQIILLGQPELRQRLLADPFEQLRQRVIASCHLPAFETTDTRDYIAHRLSVAGWDGVPSFSANAVNAIHGETGGIPRKINLLCDRLLLYGFLSEKRHLDAEDVRAVIADLRREILYTPATETGNASGDAERPKLEPIGAVPKLTDDEPTQFAEHEADNTDTQTSDAAPLSDLQGNGSPLDTDTTEQIKRLGLADSASPAPLSPEPVFTPTLVPHLEHVETTPAEPGSRQRQPISKADTPTLAARARAVVLRHRVLAIRSAAGVAALAGLIVVVTSFFGGADEVETPEPIQRADQSEIVPTAPPAETTTAAETARSETSRPEQPGGEPSEPEETNEPLDAHSAATSAAAQTQDATKRLAGQAVSVGSNEETKAEPSEPDQTVPETPETTIAREATAPSTPDPALPSASVPKPTPEVQPVDSSPITTAEDTASPTELPSEQPALSETRDQAPAMTATTVASPEAEQTQTVEQTAAPKADSSGQLEAPLARAQLTSLVRDREPVDDLLSPIQAAALPNGRLNYFTEVVEYAGHTVEHRWLYKGRRVQTRPFAIGGNRWRIYSAKSIGGNTGPWQIIVADDQGNILKKTNFVVE